MDKIETMQDKFRKGEQIGLYDQENVDDIVASTTELTEVCSRITATTSATSTDHINNSKMKDVLSVSEVFANASTQRVRKLYANLDVFHTSMGLEEKS